MSTAVPVAGFTLASLNLHCGRDRNGAPYSVSAAIRALSADVVVLQENFRPAEALGLAEQAAAGACYEYVLEIDVWRETSLARLGIVPDGAADDEPGSWGLAVLSRIPMAKIGEVCLGRAPGDDGKRIALLVELRCGATASVRLACTHLTHRLRYGPSQLRGLVRALRPDPRPTVIVGDLNMCRPAILLAQGFRPVVRGRTWPADRPLVQLDHVLAGRGVAATAQHVFDPVGSDHRAVRATLAVLPDGQPTPWPHQRLFSSRGGTTISASGSLGASPKICALSTAMTF